VLACGWARVLFVLTFLEGVLVISVLPYLAAALQAEGRSVSAAGAAAGTFGIGVLAGSQAVKALVGRLSGAELIATGGAVLVGGWAVLLAGITLPTVAVAGFVLGAGWAFFHSSMQAWATDVVPAARATAVSLFVAALFAGSACGALLAAPLIDREAFDTVFKIAFVLVGPLTIAVAAARARYARA
jgi:predicted MFS family arabinose efflux permease